VQTMHAVRLETVETNLDGDRQKNAARLEAVEAKLSETSKHIVTLTNDLQQARYAANETNSIVTNLEATITKVQSDIDASLTQWKTVEAKLSDLDALQGQAKDDVHIQNLAESVHEARFNQSKIRKQLQRAEDAEAQCMTIQAKVEELVERICQCETQLGSVDNKVSKQSMSAVDDAIKQVQKDIKEVEENVCEQRLLTISLREERIHSAG